jgi:hypothetical protein
VVMLDQIVFLTNHRLAFTFTTINSFAPASLSIARPAIRDI